MSDFRKILIKYWGYSSFRPLQEDIIESVAEGKDTLGLMPTGGGKSITFQVYSLSQPGICIVVTPLIALMKDQVENLKKRNIKAAAVYSGMRKEEIDIILDNCVYGDYKFLYLSPERLGTDIFRARLSKMNVNLLTIDEAHCISQWGYDFRPSYLKISEIREYIPETPVLALTATATPDVVKDIQEKLNFKNENVYRKSFERKNLIYVVRETDDKHNYLYRILTKVRGTGVVYVRNRKKTKEIALFLQQNKIRADYYHAGLSNQVREEKQNNWKNNRTDIMVSTNAFGMGIDKADVRVVVHLDLPDSLEAYYQEAGRAGRDEKKAYAVLLYNKYDKAKIQKRIITSFPDADKIKEIYNAVCNYLQIPVGAGKDIVFDFNMAEFCANFRQNVLVTYNSLKILALEGYIEFTEEVHIPSVIMFTVNRDDLYKFQVKNANFDNFIKLVLRSYSGVFSQYVPIDENMLAKRAGIKVNVIFNYFQNLVKMKIIKYIPQRDKPVITFIEERLDERSLRISKPVLADRKQRYEKRVDSMLHYADSDNKCRSQILRLYFGEKNPSRCGQCDVCMRRNELDLSKYEFDLILDECKKLIEANQYTVDELLDEISQNRDKTLKVLRWLLDNEKVGLTNKNKLLWN